jgi:hypothetical protein
MKHLKMAIVLGSVVTLAGCSGTGAESLRRDGSSAPTTATANSGPPQLSAGQPTRTLASNPEMEVARIDYGNDHVISFVELKPGEILLSETAQVPTTPQASLQMIQNASSWVTLYRQLAPDHDVPATLVAADQRSAVLRAQLSSQPQAEGASEVEPVAGPAAKTGGATLSSNELQGSVQTQSPTPAGWNWSSDANWFLSNFCVTDPPILNWCPTNVTWADGGTYSAHYAQSIGLCAQFDTAPGPCEFGFSSPQDPIFLADLAARHWIQYTWPGYDSEFMSSIMHGYSQYDDLEIIDFAKRIIP